MNNSLSHFRHLSSKLAFIVCLAQLPVGRPGFSQPAEPPPNPPLIATAPDPFAWTIDVQQKKTRQAPPEDPKRANTYRRLMDIYPRLLRETVEKAGKGWHREKFFDNQTKENVWVCNGIVVFQYHHFPPGKVIAEEVNSPNSPVKSGFGPDFPELSWIRPDVFVKTEMYLGHSCHYYEDKKAQPLGGGDTLTDPAGKGNRAWIDAKTRLPIAVEDDNLLKLYSYRAGPATIQPTGIFAEALARAQTLFNQRNSNTATSSH